MKAIISTTYNNTYLYFLPIITWCWNKIGADVICFIPNHSFDDKRVELIVKTASPILGGIDLRLKTHYFDSPEHKEATYAQVSRIYAAALDLPEDEILISGDVDMAVFGDYLKQKNADFDIFGYDLCPEKQYSICYISATVKAWREAMQINGRTYQQCLDDLLGGIEAEHLRGNYWGKDQETAYNHISEYSNKYLHGRARPGTQFASRRYDRDDSFILDRLSPDTIDFHMNRPGYEPQNFEIILTILKYHYPYENLDWLIQYTEAYKSLL